MFLKSDYLCINIDDIVYISEAERIVEREGEENQVWHETRIYLRNRESPVVARIPLSSFVAVRHPVAVPLCFGIEHA